MKSKNGLEGSSKMVFCLAKQGNEMTGFCLKGAVSRNSAKLGNYKMPVKLRET